MQGNAESALRQIDEIAVSISSRLVRSESQKIKKLDLSMSLTKVASDDLNGLNLEEGATQFKLPDGVNLSAAGNVDVKVTGH